MTDDARRSVRFARVSLRDALEIIAIIGVILWAVIAAIAVYGPYFRHP